MRKFPQPWGIKIASQADQQAVAGNVLQTTQLDLQCGPMQCSLTLSRCKQAATPVVYAPGTVHSPSNRTGAPSGMEGAGPKEAEGCNRPACAGPEKSSKWDPKLSKRPEALNADCITGCCCWETGVACWATGGCCGGAGPPNMGVLETCKRSICCQHRKADHCPPPPPDPSD